MAIIGKKCSKLLAGVLAFVMCLAMLPSEAVLADTWCESQFGETIYWGIADGDVVTVTGYGDMWDFSNQGEYSGYGTPMKCINDEHKYWAEKYTVTFSTQTERITSIGNYAFCGYDYANEMQFHYLTGSLHVPAAVKRIGDHAFYYDGIDELKLNDALENIESYAFANCKQLTSLNLNKNLKSIGNNAFEKCEKISSLILNEKLNSIGEYAFSGDKGIAGNLTIYKGVSEIGRSAFMGCSGLDGSLVIEEGTALKTIPEECFKNTGFTGIFSVPNGIEEIKANAFTNTCIETLYIPKSVTSIDKTAFGSGGFLKNIYYGGTEDEWEALGGPEVTGFTGITPHWNSTIVICKASFDSNEGTKVPSQTVVEGGKLDESLTHTTREGYTFKGWYDENGRKWDFNNDVLTGNITLTARWEAIEAATETPTEEDPYIGDYYYTITATAGEGGTISPAGNVRVGEGASKTFTISASDGYHISYVKVDDYIVGAVSSYTFYDVYENHTIEAYFIEGDGFCVHFETYDSDVYVPDQYVKSGGLVSRPADPKKTGYEFKDWFTEPTYEHVWDFGRDTVTADITLYAYFVAIDKSTTDFYLLSSTGMLGKWIDTVIGQGCTVKLSLANSDGKKLKGISNSSIQWKISPYYSDGTKAEDYFTLSNGKLKCNKDAPTGYTAMVTATYDNKNVYYIVTVIKKVGKMGYVDSAGKFRSSLTVNVSPGSSCDFGYGPHNYIKEKGKYVAYYDKGNGRIGTALYEQPNGRHWQTYGYMPEYPVYYCSAKLPKKTSIATRDARDYSSWNYYPVYYFTLQKGSRTVTYIAPDGSGKKFKVKFKVKESKKR